MAIDYKTPYLFALTNPGNEDLLKESVRISNLGLVPSYSRPGFVSFKKTAGLITAGDIAKFPFAYARLIGADAKALDKSAPHPSNYFDCESQNAIGELESGDTCFFHLGKETFWECERSKTRTELNHPYGSPALIKPEVAPSRAYLKIAESFELKKIKLSEVKRVIELGCAPGGASTFLLSKNLEVFGIDPAKVEESVTNHARFHYLNKAVQEVSKADLPGDFDLLASDMNLNPSQTVAFSLKLLELLKNKPQTLLITLKTPELKWVAQISKTAKKLQQAGYLTSFAQLPTHRRETLIYCSSRR